MARHGAPGARDPRHGRAPARWPDHGPGCFSCCVSSDGYSAGSVRPSLWSFLQSCRLHEHVISRVLEGVPTATHNPSAALLFLPFSRGNHAERVYTLTDLLSSFIDVLIASLFLRFGFFVLSQFPPNSRDFYASPRVYGLQSTWIAYGSTITATSTTASLWLETSFCVGNKTKDGRHTQAIIALGGPLHDQGGHQTWFLPPLRPRRKRCTELLEHRAPQALLSLRCTKQSYVLIFTYFNKDFILAFHFEYFVIILVITHAILRQNPSSLC